MRHPHKYDTCLKYVFIFVVSAFATSPFKNADVFQTVVDVAMATIGYLLYGDRLLECDGCHNPILRRHGDGDGRDCAVDEISPTVRISRGFASDFC